MTRNTTLCNIVLKVSPKIGTFPTISIRFSNVLCKALVRGPPAPGGLFALLPSLLSLLVLLVASNFNSRRTTEKQE